jgi:hypothetical protein
LVCGLLPNHPALMTGKCLDDAVETNSVGGLVSVHGSFDEFSRDNVVCVDISQLDHFCFLSIKPVGCPGSLYPYAQSISSLRLRSAGFDVSSAALFCVHFGAYSPFERARLILSCAWRLTFVATCGRLFVTWFILEFLSFLN